MDIFHSLNDFRDFVNTLSFTFAKTYEDFAPHEYVVFHKNSEQTVEMAKAVEFINSNGYTIHFYGHSTFKCISMDGMRYWYAYTSDIHSAPDILNRTSNNNRQGIPKDELHLLESHIT